MITGKFPNLRLRRSRKYAWSRRLIQENNLSSNDFIYPIFLIEGKNRKIPIRSMPGIYKYTIDKIDTLVSNAIKNKIPMVALFPSTPNKKKDYYGKEALNENSLKRNNFNPSRSSPNKFVNKLELRMKLYYNDIMISSK